MITNETFTEQYTKYFEKTVRFMRRRVACQDDAVDVASVAWARAWECRGQFREGCSFYTWVCSIAVHATIDDYRWHRTLRTEPLSPYFDVKDQVNLEADLLAEEVHGRLMSLIGQIKNKDQREAVFMRLEGLALEEVAKLQGICVGTVKTNVRRGIQAARAMAAKA